MSCSVPVQRPIPEVPNNNDRHDAVGTIDTHEADDGNPDHCVLGCPTLSRSIRLHNLSEVVDNVFLPYLFHQIIKQNGLT